MYSLLKVLLIVLILVFLIKKNLDLGIIFFSGAILSGFLFGLGLKALRQNLFETLKSGETLSLIGIIFLVLYLGAFLHARGNFKSMVDSMKRILPDARLILAFPSAFIGLLPMLGGALMSAPIVNEAGNRWKLLPHWKTFFNYWFRHIWEYCWPLYVNLILTSAILKIPIKSIAAVQFPFTILAASLGLVILFKHVQHLPREGISKNYLKDLFNLFFSIWPIILAIILIFAFKFSLLFSLAVVALLTQVFSRMNFRERFLLFWESFSIKTMFLIASVMMFKGVLEGSGALNSLNQIIRPEGFSAYFFLFAVPFFLGFLTGVNHAYVGIAFPILIPIFGMPEPDMVLVMFAYVSGFVGVLLSPAHLCLALTIDYFKANLRDVYKILVWPSMIVFFVSFLVILFLRII